MLICNRSKVAETLLRGYPEVFADGIEISESKNRIFLIDPFLIEGRFWCLAPVWDIYLNTNYPDKDLIVLGFYRYTDAKFMNLSSIKFGEAFEVIFSDVKALNITSLDIRAQIRSFFEGHGKYSLIKSLSVILQVLDSAYTAQSEQNCSDDDIQRFILSDNYNEIWATFTTRWERFFSYFEWLPFREQIEKIGQTIEINDTEIRELLTGKINFLNRELLRAIRGVINELQEIDRIYGFSSYQI